MNAAGIPVLVKLAYVGRPSRAEFPLTKEFAEKSTNSTVGLTGRATVIASLIATGLIISVPLVMRMPWLRRTPIGKLIELGGGAALVVKFAEMIRDWEREQEATTSAQVIDVPPVGSV